MTRERRSRPDFGATREAGSGLRPWGLIRAATSPALGLPGAERVVLVALARHADAFGYCHPSLKRLAKCAGFGERRTWQAVKTLEQIGLIAAERENGRATTYRIEVAAVEKHAGPEPKAETAAPRARVGEAENVGSNGPKPETVAKRAKVASAPTVPGAAPQPATLADNATPLANSGETVARGARTVARGANELEANMNMLSEKGCAGAHRAPTKRELREAELLLAEAEQRMPARYRQSIELAKIAYQKNPNPTLLKALLERLATEVATAGPS